MDYPNNVQKFVADLQSNPELLKGAVPVSGSLASVVDYANKSGYSITLDEAKQHLQTWISPEALDGANIQGGGANNVNNVQKFITDLQSNPELLKGAVPAAGNLAAVVEYANKSGYPITLDQAKQHLQGLAGRDLSNSELDTVALGKGMDPPPGLVKDAGISSLATIQTQIVISGTAVVLTQAVAEAVAVALVVVNIA